MHGGKLSGVYLRSLVVGLQTSSYQVYTLKVLETLHALWLFPIPTLGWQGSKTRH